MNSVLEIPGYQEAIQRERFIRDAAFLGVSETVAGFELKPFTLRHYIVLRIANNPLLMGGTPSPVELAQFLWLCSVGYRPDARAMRRFMKRCRAFVPPAEPWIVETKRWRKQFNAALLRCAEALKACREYLQEAVMDKPPHSATNTFKPDYYSEVAFWLALFKYSYTPDQVLDMPMKVLYQCLNEAKERASLGVNKPSGLFNPSDAVRSRWQAEANKPDHN